MADIKKDIRKLVDAGVIDDTIAARIDHYYQSVSPDKSNRLLLVSGAIGALLIGLGIILIIGHNWDGLSIKLKSVLTFLPLILSQALVFFVKLKKSESVVWREVASVLLFFSIAASIALISQIYHIQGDIHSFLVTWCLLGIPIIYLMPSSVVSLLSLTLIIKLGYSRNLIGSFNTDYAQLGLWALCLPYYWHLITTRMSSNTTAWHHWLMCILAFVILLPSVLIEAHFGIIGVLALFSAFYGMGKSALFKDNRLRSNPFLILGAIGTVIALYVTTFSGFWNDANPSISGKLSWLDYLPTVLTIGLAFYFLYKENILNNWRALNPIRLCFFIYIPIYFFLSPYPVMGMILSNLLLIAIGVYYVVYGIRIEHATILNFGMLILSLVIMTRFLSVELSFVTRGIAFVVMGIIFLITNLLIVKRKKAS